MNKYLIQISGSLIVASLLAGCGGGSSDATPQTETTDIRFNEKFGGLNNHFFL